MSALRISPRKGFIGRAIAIFGAASSAAAADEGHRMPRDRDLYDIGMSPVDFNSIKL